jgi:hypothetical protein
MKHIVFDFGRMLFEWQSPRLLRREFPHLAYSFESAQRLAMLFLQGYGGDRADFDRGTVGVTELVQRIAARTGLQTDGNMGVVGRRNPRVSAQYPEHGPAARLQLARLRGAGHDRSRRMSAWRRTSMSSCNALEPCRRWSVRCISMAMGDKNGPELKQTALETNVLLMNDALPECGLARCNDLVHS